MITARPVESRTLKYLIILQAEEADEKQSNWHFKATKALGIQLSMVKAIILYYDLDEYIKSNWSLNVQF